ncbi:MAG: hypothetical protein ACJ72W_21000 [Actinoallomurus sp.]
MTQPPPYPQPSPDPYGRQPYQGGPQGYQQPYAAPQQYQQGYQAPQGYPPAQGQPAGYPQPYPGDQGYQGQQPAYQAYQGQPAAYQAAPAQAYPGPMAAPGVPGGLTCRVCGSGPAAKATFRGVVGAVIMHTIWTATGPFCRDCGLATFRKQTAKTLAGGWCSIGALVLTPFFLLFNVIARGKVANLSAPQPTVSGGPMPLDPGPPVFQRPTAYIYPVIFVLFWMLVIIGNLSGS